MSLAERLVRIVESKKDKLIALTQALIRIPTVNTPPHGDEKPAQEFLHQRLLDLNAESDLFTLDQVPGLTDDPFYNKGRDACGRPDLVGRWQGTGGGRSLMLTGHVDVVGVGDPAKWDDDPWSGALRQGRIHGRGAGDMKGGPASELVAIESVLECGAPLGDLLFSSVVDEEFGGMNGTLAVVRRGYRADAAILAEPTGLVPFPATGGGLQYRLHVRGKSAFEGRKDKGECAILRMANIVTALDQLEKERSARFKHDKYFGSYPIPAPICIIEIAGGNVEVGGVADKCWIEAWHQALPGETEEQIIRELQDKFHQLAANDPWLRDHLPAVEPRCKWMDPCLVPDGHPFIPVLSEAWTRVVGRRPEMRGMMGASDASRLQLAADIATVNFGPGSLTTHLPNENVLVDELVIAAKVMALTILNWCGLRET